MLKEAMEKEITSNIDVFSLLRKDIRSYKLLTADEEKHSQEVIFLEKNANRN